MEKQKSKHLLGNLTILLFFLTGLSLGFHGFLSDDGTYTFLMFSYPAIYTVDYYWIFENSTQPYEPGNELKGKTKKMLYGEKRRVKYQVGNVITAIEKYSQYMFEHKKPAGARAFQTQLAYTRAFSSCNNTLILNYSKNEETKEKMERVLVQKGIC